jgi:hypothetical protein
MTPLAYGPNFAPAPQTVALVRERLQRLGLAVSEAAARTLVDAVLAIEAPRLHAQIKGAFENSLEIIRDTAESALGGPAERRTERSDLIGGGRRLVAPPPLEEIDEDEPRPVFKRPRR